MRRFQLARNYRIVAAYEERLALAEEEAAQRRLLGVGAGDIITQIAAAKSTARQLRQRQNFRQSPGEQAYASSQYFRRHKVVIGLSSSPSPPHQCY